ncbi:MAG: murein biosynthesis integral membrane protein MurJ [Planctomycetes bacterium]|nr:murein biosynthesis integral membrane protein MurJ [Planctomycetota bacterium]
MNQSEVAATPQAGIGGRHKRLMARTVLISFFTAVSRVFGYGREALTAALFGDTSAVYDAFVTAWRVPNLFRRLLGEGAVSVSLVRAMTKEDHERGNDAGRALMWETLRLAARILFALTVLVMGAVALMPDTMPMTGWRWLGDDAAVMRELTVHVAPYVIVICLAGLAGGALSVRERFIAASAGPGVMNAIAIATLVLIGWRFGWEGLAPVDGAAGRERHLDMARWLSWGLLASGAAQLALLVPELRAAKLLERATPSPKVRAKAVEVLKTSLPLALGAAVYQINVLVDSFMANNLLEIGGASTYYYANRIQQLPLALVATAATSAVFPAMQALAQTRSFGELRRLHEQTHLGVAFIALPASVGLFVLATPVTSVLLEHGAFSERGVERTADAITMLCIALVPGGAVSLITRAYWALGDYRTPVKVAVAMLVLNVLLNLAFVVGLDMDTGGLALATAVVSWLNVAVLVPGLNRRLREQQGGEVAGLPDLGARVVRIAAASAASGLAAYQIWSALDVERGSAFGLFVAIAAGITTYVIAAQLLGSPEWRSARERVIARLRHRGAR